MYNTLYGEKIRRKVFSVSMFVPRAKWRTRFQPILLSAWYGDTEHNGHSWFLRSSLGARPCIIRVRIRLYLISSLCAVGSILEDVISHAEQTSVHLRSYVVVMELLMQTAGPRDYLANMINKTTTSIWLNSILYVTFIPHQQKHNY